jgi:hypothetical protein
MEGRMGRTPKLGLPYLAAGQAQKHVTVNEGLRLIDGLAQMTVESRTTLAAPTTPAPGSAYIVPAGATGLFAGKLAQVARYIDGGWEFLTPQEGWLAYVRDEGAYVCLSGGVWRGLGSVLAEVSVQRLAIGTNIDANNPLTATLNDALLNAKSVATGGTGNLRFKINKDGQTRTASHLFQSGFSGRAEFGLIGGDDFVLKVSSDGAIWSEALRVLPGGRTLHPANPMFHAAGMATLPVAPVALNYATTYLNFGDAFDPALGRFTAPVSGRYQFFGSALKSDASAVGLAFRRNGLLAFGRHSYGGTTAFVQCHGSLIINLNAGDYVEQWIEQGNIWNGADCASFSGGLIG